MYMATEPGSKVRDKGVAVASLGIAGVDVVRLIHRSALECEGGAEDNSPGFWDNTFLQGPAMPKASH